MPRSAPGFWQSRGALAWSLFPFSLLFALLAGLRRRLFTLGILKSVRLPVRVVVVGNVAVGGSGKTPIVLWLVELLRSRGFKPGIVSRGYGRFGLKVLPRCPSMEIRPVSVTSR